MLLFLAGCLINTELYDERHAALSDEDGDGVRAEEDCDDGDAHVSPAQEERCDGLDNDCDEAVDEDAADAPAWYVDADGDGHGAGSPVLACTAPAGHVAGADDCDDLTASTHPGAVESWYDGDDSDCDGADDYDQDGDGDTPIEFEGSDCDDQDAGRAGTIVEGWLDIDIDNDCDGSTEDAVSLDLSTQHRIDGPQEDAQFGSTILVVPQGAFDDEAWVLVGAGPLDGYSGGVYGWPASELSGATSAAEAPWKIEGGGFLGYALGLAGEPDAPIVLVSEVTTGENRGSVLAWSGPAVGGGRDDTTFILSGDLPDLYVGSSLLSGTDLDGDGIDDLVTSSVLDSRVSPNAGTVGLFYDPGALSGAVSYAEYDVLFSVMMPGANMYPVAVGDADDDGLDDLGFVLAASTGEDPAGTLFLSSFGFSGAHDVISASVATFRYCAPHTALDVDGDGAPELLALGGIVWQIDLPVEGSVVPWDPMVGQQGFTDSTVDWVAGLDTRVPFWDGRRALASSYVHDGSRGAVAIDRLAWGESSIYEDAKYVLEGEAGGDRFGSATGFIDHSGDGVEDVIITAPGVDGEAANSGAVYVLPSPN